MHESDVSSSRSLPRAGPRAAERPGQALRRDGDDSPSLAFATGRLRASGRVVRPFDLEHDDVDEDDEDDEEDDDEYYDDGYDPVAGGIAVLPRPESGCLLASMRDLGASPASGESAWDGVLQ